MTQLVLASQSPRRRALLENLNIKFRVMVKETEETMVNGVDPKNLAMENARQKALALKGAFDQETFVLAADTVVYQNGRLMGKPADETEAIEMLRSLSGTSHQVITGVAIVHYPSERVVCDSVVTEVYFKPLQDTDILAYVATADPMDKAGAYGIQGLASLFVEKIVGDYYNVVGLPLFKIEEILNKKFHKSLLTDFLNH